MAFPIHCPTPGHETPLEAALKYRAEGFSVIPLVARDKTPIISWTRYQSALPSEEEIRRWWKDYPFANIGAIMGRISGGVVAVDIDMRSGGLDTMKTLALPETRTHATGGGGFHYFYRAPGIVHKKIGLFQGIDLIGEGGYCVMPPSIHASGGQYSLLKDIAIHDAPNYLLECSDVTRVNSNSELIRIGVRHESIKRSIRGYANSTRHSFILLWKRATAMIISSVEPSDSHPITIEEVFDLCVWAWNETHHNNPLWSPVAWKMLEGRNRREGNIPWGTPTTSIHSLHPK